MAVRLEEVLVAEFDALRDQRLEAFERMQPEKEAALAGLAQLLDEIRRSAGSLEAAAAALPSDWEVFRTLMEQCREAHRRNDILVRSQLATIQSTLEILGQGQASAPVALYDRMGRVGPGNRGRGYAEA